jgi:hypothetical protein
MTEQDLLNNARELLRLASEAVDDRQFAAAKGFSAMAARCLEEAEVIATMKRRKVEDEAA